MKKPNNKLFTTLAWCFLYLLVAWLAVITAGIYQEGLSIFEIIPRISEAMNEPLELTYDEYTLRFIFILSLLYGAGIATYYASEAKRRTGEEHGSAAWGNPREVRNQFKQNKETDRLFTKNVRMGLDAYKHRRNLNTLTGRKASARKR